ncbi:coiled-coil domain-containing protein 97 [Anticarsia gemmatalis]|uniref:coiled-coil domain-containing protein 97 n=1 Tax=Anticarsia gemmatalis TaxID=129554 RepID=UPI003F773572
MISTEDEVDVDPIHDIIDYLVRCAKISFKNAHVDESEVRTSEKIRMALDFYKRSPTEFLQQYGKYLAPYHIDYFDKLQSSPVIEHGFRECVEGLKRFHSDKSRHKRIRNRRYNALQKLKTETDYFSEKEMMYRKPLLYEQLVGQYLSDEEIRDRDKVDNENLTFLSMILETVDRNDMREMKNEQMLEEDLESITITNKDDDSDSNDSGRHRNTKHWGEFDTPDTRPSYMPEKRKQCLITAPERNLLREEFLHEMYSSFIDGRDEDFDYSSIDNDEQYDDLQQVSQDAEDKYFDSETNDIENLEEHMKLVQEYGRKNSDNNPNTNDDPLDVFMKHVTNKLDLT